MKQFINMYQLCLYFSDVRELHERGDRYQITPLHRYYPMDNHLAFPFELSLKHSLMQVDIQHDLLFNGTCIPIIRTILHP